MDWTNNKNSKGMSMTPIEMINKGKELLKTENSPSEKKKALDLIERGQKELDKLENGCGLIGEGAIG